MTPAHDNPDFWMAKADECRQLADQLQDEPCKKVVLEIGQSYERLAMMAEAKLLRKGVVDLNKE